MALGLSKSVIEAEITRDLVYCGLDQRAITKIAQAVAEAVNRNNRRLEQQLAETGIDGLQAIMNEPQPIVRRVGVI